MNIFLYVAVRFYKLIVLKKSSTTTCTHYNCMWKHLEHDWKLKKNQNLYFKFKIQVQNLNPKFQFKIQVQNLNLKLEFKIWISNLKFKFKIYIQYLDPNSNSKFKSKFKI